MGIEKYTTEETFGSGICLGDDQNIQNLTPQERLYVSAWREACPQPDATVKYYGSEWLKEWKKEHESEPTPSQKEIDEHGVALARRRYDECNFVYGYIVSRVKSYGPAKSDLYRDLVSPVFRKEGEPMGYHEPGRVPESHKTRMSTLSRLVIYALPRVPIEIFGWDGSPRTWEKYEKGLRIIEDAIRRSKTSVQLLAVMSESVLLAGGRPEKILDHVLSPGIEVEENNHSEYLEVKNALKKYAPNLWRCYQGE